MSYMRFAVGDAGLKQGWMGKVFFSQGGAKPKIYKAGWGRVLNLQGRADTNF